MRDIREGILNQESAITESIGGSALDAFLDGRIEAVPESQDRLGLEAIILLRGRPVLLIQDGRWVSPSSGEIARWLGDPDNRANPLVKRIPSVGRVEVLNSSSDYLGTGWMLAEDVLVTNRHIAAEFGMSRGGGFDFRSNSNGEKYQARVDFRREYERSDISRVGIEQILFIEDSGGFRPDMALVRLSRNCGALPPPIELDDASLTDTGDDKSKLAIIGYPAEDGRNDAFAMRQIFQGIYRVKRLSPGRVMTVSPDGKTLEHDCTTLGGNSGSPVINLETGKACGLHYSGTYRERNFAVTAAWLKSRLQELSNRTSITMPAQPGGVAPVAASSIAAVQEGFTRAADEFNDRLGYQEKFLGESDNLAVPMPEIAQELQNQIAPVRGNASGVLNYTHFSIMMRKDRRLPFFTAVNIDGNLLFNISRGRDNWYFDGRLDRTFQIGEDLYRSNNLDRGHLVRRLDPVWGATRAEGKQAEMDTFAFANCTPQHSQLNQQTWLSLEDHILTNADTRDFKASVFSGPVMSEEDMEYRGVQIPSEFWKVAVMVNSSTGALSATGYLLSQADYLRNIEFVFGAFRTYQVAISEIEAKTGLVFNLGLFDPMGRAESLPYRELSNSADIVL